MIEFAPTMTAMHYYVAGEIDSAAGRRDQAEEHYARGVELARAGQAIDRHLTA